MYAHNDIFGLVKAYRVPSVEAALLVARFGGECTLMSVSVISASNNVMYTSTQMMILGLAQLKSHSRQATRRLLVCL